MTTEKGKVNSYYDALLALQEALEKDPGRRLNIAQFFQPYGLNNHDANAMRAFWASRMGIEPDFKGFFYRGDGQRYYWSGPEMVTLEMARLAYRFRTNYNRVVRSDITAEKAKKHGMPATEYAVNYLLGQVPESRYYGKEGDYTPQKPDPEPPLVKNDTPEPGPEPGAQLDLFGAIASMVEQKPKGLHISGFYGKFKLGLWIRPITHEADE